MEPTEVAASHGRPQIPYQESVNNSAQQFEGGESEFPPPPPPQMDLFYWYGVPHAVLGVARDTTPFIMPLASHEARGHFRQHPMTSSTSLSDSRNFLQHPHEF